MNAGRVLLMMTISTFLVADFVLSRSIFQYSNMDPRISGQNCIFFKVSFVSIPKRDVETKKTPPNGEVCPGNLVAMSEY